MKNLYSKIFLWLALGLLVTFGTGYLVTLYPNMLFKLLGSWGYIVCIIAELVLVSVLSFTMFKVKPSMAKAMFLLYSVVTGLTFSSIFVNYNLNSITIVFLVTAVIYGIFALFGYLTKLKLNKTWPYLLATLIGVIVVSIINLFLNSSRLEMILSIITIIVFLLITAYDMKRIKNLKNMGLPKENLAIYGALDLYLDFINVFMNLISMFGNNDD